MRNRDPLELRWIFTVPLELWWGFWESSQVASGGFGLILSCDGELGFPLKLHQGTQNSS